MYKNFQKSNNNRSIKYSFLASFSIMVFLFTFITNTAYGATTTTVTNIGEFAEPTLIAVDKSGNNIYVAEDSVITKINISNSNTTTAAVCLNPNGLAVDSSGNIYVSDPVEGKIYKTDKDFNTTTLDNNEIIHPRSLALDSSNNIYFVDFATTNIKKCNSNGDFIRSFDNVDVPYDIAVDNIGNIYVNNNVSQNYDIEKLDAEGNFIATIISGDNNSNMHIAVDSSDNLYISQHDSDNKKNIIYKMNNSGQMKVYASYDSEDVINGIAVDNDGNIYITEGDCVKEITVSPELKIDTTNPPNATVGRAYSYTFTSTGGIGTKTYAVTGGSLPAGLTLSTNGTLSGIPTTIGSGTFTITATDSATPTASTSSITVNLAVIVPPTSGRSGSDSNSDSTSTPASNSSLFTATVTNGQYQFTAPPLPFEITTGTDGTKTGKVQINEKIAKGIVDSLKVQGGDTAIVNMPNPQGELSSLTASIPTAAITTFVNSGKNLELETPSGGVTLSNQNMKDYVNVSNQPLYFTITPVNDAMTQTETDIRAVKLQIEQIEQIQIQNTVQLVELSQLKQQLIQQLKQLEQQLKQLEQQQQQLAMPTNGIINETKERQSELQGLSNGPIRVGSSVDMESNMPRGIRVGVSIPMGPVNSPAQEAEMKKGSTSYVMFAEHSMEDIENLLISTIRIKNMTAIAEANTNRFSRFTIIRLSQNTTDVGNWQNDEQGWKYIKNGEPATGWNQIGGYWYLMEQSGTMETGWKQVDGKWYFLKSDGAMATGWQEVNGKWYYLYSNGSMASNVGIDGYTLDSSGAWV